MKVYILIFDVYVLIIFNQNSLSHFPQDQCLPYFLSSPTFISSFLIYFYSLRISYMYTMYFDNIYITSSAKSYRVCTHPTIPSQLPVYLSTLSLSLPSLLLFLLYKNRLNLTYELMIVESSTEARSTYQWPHPARKLALSLLAVINCQYLLSRGLGLMCYSIDAGMFADFILCSQSQLLWGRECLRECFHDEKSVLPNPRLVH